jgi:hypothetical protein
VAAVRYLPLWRLGVWGAAGYAGARCPAALKYASPLRARRRNVASGRVRRLDATSETWRVETGSRDPEKRDANPARSVPNVNVERTTNDVNGRETW